MNPRLPLVHAALVLGALFCLFWVFGCTRAETPIKVLYHDDSVTYIAATHDVFVKRFPFLKTQFRDDKILSYCGFYDRNTDQCWVVAEDPCHLTDYEYYVLEHEAAHYYERRCGWEYARLVWLDIRATYPSLMTHPDINARL